MVASLCHHCCTGNAIICTTCTVEPHVSQQYKNIKWCTKIFFWQIYDSREKKKKYSALHVKCLTFLSNFNQTLTFLTDFHKIHNIKFHRNPSSGGSCTDACRRMDRKLDTMKPKMHFATHVNAPKNSSANPTTDFPLR